MIGTNLAAKDPDRFGIGKRIELSRTKLVLGLPYSCVSTGVVATGGAEDNAILVPLSVVQKLSSNRPGEFRQLFISAITKPADALADRDPKSLTPAEYDRWFCSPYISSISYQIEQVLPGTDVRAIRRVADSEGKILSHVSALLWIVTLAALIAAALAIAATSAAAVLERRAEIGVMKAIGATNTAVTALFLAEHLTLALIGGALGFLVGAGLARMLGESVFGTAAPARLVLLPIILALAALVALDRRLDSPAAGGAIRSRADPAGRVMFGRLLWKLLRSNRGRLAVALVAVISGAAVISALLTVEHDISRKLTSEFRLLGPNVLISAKGAGQSSVRRRFRTLMDEQDVFPALQQARSPNIVAAVAIPLLR